MDDHAARERRRKKLKAYGRFDTGLVDAEPVRQHLLELGAFGLGYKRVAQLTGLGITPVRTILWGRQEPGPRNGELPKRIARDKAQKLLALQPRLEYLADGQATPARATVRRIQSLIAFGYSQSEIARQIGWTTGNLSAMRLRYEAAARRGRAGQVHVQASTARAVEQLYDRLSATPPPQRTAQQRAVVSRARAMGREKGWPLPMDWEAYENDFARPQAPRRSA